jgi:hypothetical protein
MRITLLIQKLRIKRLEVRQITGQDSQEYLEKMVANFNLTNLLKK